MVIKIYTKQVHTVKFSIIVFHVVGYKKQLTQVKLYIVKISDKILRYLVYKIGIQSRKKNYELMTRPLKRIFSIVTVENSLQICHINYYCSNLLVRSIKRAIPETRKL